MPFLNFLSMKGNVLHSYTGDFSRVSSHGLKWGSKPHKGLNWSVL